MKQDSASELGLPSKIIKFWRNINKYTVDLIKELFQQLQDYYSCFEWKIGKLENVQIFKYKILIIASKKERETIMI